MTAAGVDGRGLRAGADPHLFADPRRSARARQRRLPPRQAHLPQSLRRRHGDPGRRRAADARLSGARAARRAGRPQGAPDRRTRHGRRHRRRHDRRPGGRSRRRRQAARRRSCSKPSIAPRPARCCAPACAWARIYAGAADAQYEALSCYGEHVGLAFQIVDDILDVEESSEALGKTAGKDAQQHKITFPAVYGLETSRAHGRGGVRARARGAGAVRRPRAAPARTGRPDRPAANHEDRGWTGCWSSAVSPNRARKRRRSSWPARCWSTGRRPTSPASPSPTIAAVEVLARPPYVSRGGLKLAGALRHFAHRRRGQGLPRCRRVHRRLHRLPAAARRRARARRRCAAPASSTGSCATIRAWWCTKASTRATSPRRHRRAGRTSLVCDVSFISVTLILPAARTRLLRPGGQMVILVKPQFEVGKGQVGKGGIVRDPGAAPGGLRDESSAPCANSDSRPTSSKAPSAAPKGTRSFSSMPVIKTVGIISKPNVARRRRAWCPS